MILSIPVLTPVLKRFLTRHIPSPGNAYSKKRNSNLRNPCGFMMMRKLDVIILNCESLFMLPSQIMSNRISDLKKILVWSFQGWDSIWHVKSCPPSENSEMSKRGRQFKKVVWPRTFPTDFAPKVTDHLVNLIFKL